MAFNLRLPPALDSDARARCDRMGISLNALVCVALDQYLRAADTPPVDAVLPVSEPEKPVFELEKPVSAPKKQQLNFEFVLPKNPSKKDLAKFHNLQFEKQKASKKGPL